jgi:isoamyl acetate esterase
VIVLFGDSLVQRSWGGWGSDLAQLYLRKADVINRGFSGFTSMHGAVVLEQLLNFSEQVFVRYSQICSQQRNN